MAGTSPAMTSHSLLSRRVAYLIAALTIALLPLLFTGSYWRTNLIVCALNVMLAFRPTGLISERREENV